MVHTLIRLRLAVLTHALRTKQASLIYTGAALGAVAASVTLLAGFLSFDDPAAHSDMMVFLFAVWTLGWAVGPTLFGGEDQTLRPENFRFLPISSTRLAAILLGASLATISVIVTLAAFLSLIAYAAQGGLAATIISVPAVLLQLALVVTLSRFITSAFRRLTRSHLSAVIGAAVIGTLQAFLVTGWALFALDDIDFAGGFPTALSSTLHALPSGWAVLSIDAVRDGNWTLGIVTLGGLTILSGTFTVGWAEILRRRLSETRVRTREIRSYDALLQHLPKTPTGAVIRKEFLTWLRDHTRTSDFYFAFFYAVAICLFPLAAGFSEALPWAGALFVLSAVGATANVYGYDGSSLWLTLVTPVSKTHDVRGRQFAWLLFVGPVALTVTIALTLASSQLDLLLAALTVVCATLGAGAGMLAFGSVYWLIPMTDPHKRTDDMAEHGIDPGKFIVNLLFTMLLALPAASVAYLGWSQGFLGLEIVGLATGIATGMLYTWWFGRLAARRLDAQAPELLNEMLKGPPVVVEDEPEPELPKPATRRVAIYGIAGAILLFPQSLLPLLMTVADQDVQLWFLPLYLSGALRFLTIALFGLTGTGLLILAFRIYQRHAIQ